MLVFYLQLFDFAVESGYPRFVIFDKGIVGGTGFNAADIVFHFTDCFLFCLKNSKIVQLAQFSSKLASVSTAAVSNF